MYKISFILIVHIFLSSCSSDGYETSLEKVQSKVAAINHTVDVSEVLAKFPKKQIEEIQKTTKQDLDNFYTERNYCSYWFGTEKPTSRLLSLNYKLQELIKAGETVFSAYDDTINATIKSVYDRDILDTKTLAEADLKITELYALFANSLLQGQLTNYSNGKAYWFVEDEGRNVLNDLVLLGDGNQLDSLLNKYRPNMVGYKALLNKFKEIDDNKDTTYFNFSCDFLEWDSLASDSLTPKLAERLNQWGVKREKNKSASSTNRQLAQFQSLRGLPNTGKLDCETVQELNMNKEAVLDKISLNLERLKSLPQRKGKEYIFVNIPEYELRIFEEDKLSFQSKVIVGKEYNPTPVFVDTLSYLVFSPTWTVPQSIVQNEMIPNLRKNANHYIKKNFKAYENGKEINQNKIDWNHKNITSRYFVFVQQPGSSNALGLVKFIMPNDLSIYLHDTPTDYLFDRTERRLSHGCVRLEKPKELANYLLKDSDEWTESKIAEAMNADSPIQVNLDKKIPVEIVYLTTWVNQDGELAILPDVYGHDAEQMKLLSELNR